MQLKRWKEIWEKQKKKRFGNSEFGGFKVWGNFVSQPYSPLSSQILYDMAGLGLYLYLGLRFDTWLKKKKIWRRREFDEVRVWDLIFNLRNWKVKSNE
jgi:hypothetical protein